MKRWRTALFAAMLALSAGPLFVLPQPASAASGSRAAQKHKPNKHRKHRRHRRHR